MSALNDDDRKDIRTKFNQSVNMTPSELQKWLDTDESKAVGQKSSSSSESIGHQSGERIIRIKDTKNDDLTDNDYTHMRKVNSYVSRHLAQGPETDVEDSPWRHSLMNWGHDPLKK